MTLDPRLVHAELTRRGFLWSYGLLAGYQVNLRAREHMTLKAEQDWRSTARKLVETPEDPWLLRRLHLEQLDLLLRICMYLEDFAYLVHLLQHRPRSMHLAIHFSGQTRASAIGTLRHMPLPSLRALFGVPHYTKLGLPSQHLRTVKEVFGKYVAGLRQDADRVVQFHRQHYFDVYNEYKHSFDVFIGMQGQTSGSGSSHIYLRVPKEVRRKGKKRKSYRQWTYILDTGPEAVSYYMRVFGSISNLAWSLVLNNLDHMLYADGRYLIKIPKAYGVSGDLLREYEELIPAHGLCWSKSHQLNLNLHFAGREADRLQADLQESFVAVLRRPLLSSRSGKITTDLKAQ